MVLFQLGTLSSGTVAIYHTTLDHMKTSYICEQSAESKIYIAYLLLIIPSLCCWVAFFPGIQCSRVRLYVMIMLGVVIVAGYGDIWQVMTWVTMPDNMMTAPTSTFASMKKFTG